MAAFTYEEQGGRRYLVYEKKAEDILDTVTMEMISNNKIDGMIPFSYIQIDNTVYMKYDITGLESLHELLSNTINRKKILHLLESLADAVILAEDYMLELSSYVLDSDYLYVDSDMTKILVVVLPIKRKEIPVKQFLKELLYNVHFDQTEDRGYVASLMESIGTTESFSISKFKEQISRFMAEKPKKVIPQEKKENDGREISTPPMIKVPEDEKKKKEREIALKTLFGDKGKEEEKEESEKKIKHFIGKILKKKKKSESEEEDFGGGVLNGIEIPGGRTVKETNPSEEKNKSEKAVIPSQKIDIKQHEIEEQDFGNTEISEDTEDTETTLMEKDACLRFVLNRCSTKKSYEIQGDINGGIIRIGRNPNISEVCISGNKCIGRTHAILYVRDGQVSIEDNHSKNKTYVNGIRVNPDDGPQLLTSGSKIRLGNEEFEFTIYE